MNAEDGCIRSCSPWSGSDEVKRQLVGGDQFRARGDQASQCLWLSSS